MPPFSEHMGGGGGGGGGDWSLFRVILEALLENDLLKRLISIKTFISQYA